MMTSFSAFDGDLPSIALIVLYKINDYLTEMSRFLRDSSLLMSAPKSTVTLFTPDSMQANTQLNITISDAELPLVRNPKLLGVYLDTFLFNSHCVQVTNRVSKRNNKKSIGRHKLGTTKRNATVDI